MEVPLGGPRVEPMTGEAPCGGMEAWRVEAYRAIGLAITPTTRKGYERALHQFEAFWKNSGYQATWPIPLVVSLAPLWDSIKGQGVSNKFHQELFLSSGLC